MRENIEVSLDSATNVAVYITQAYDYTDQEIEEELLEVGVPVIVSFPQMVFLTAVSIGDEPASYKISYGNQVFVPEEVSESWYSSEEFVIYSTVGIILCPFMCLLMCGMCNFL